MAYVKNTWATGDVITETKLNHMEDGIAASGASLELHKVIDETVGRMYSGTEVQAIMDALPEQVILIDSFEDDPDPYYTKTVYRKNSFSVDANNAPLGCVYASFDDAYGDGVGVQYIYISATNGAVVSFADARATEKTSSYSEFAYDSTSGYWKLAN